MSNLKPEVRRDKNGRLVTRHVKVDSPTAKQGNIPAPAAPTVDHQYSASPVSMAEYSEAMGVYHSRNLEEDKHVRANFMHMSLMTPDSFRELIDIFRTAEDHTVSLLNTVMSLPHQGTEQFNRTLLVNLSVMETIAELQGDTVNRASKGVGVYRGHDLWQASRMSLSSTYGKPFSVKLFKATSFAMWTIGFHDGKSRIDVTEQMDNLKFIADNFDAVMERRDVIRASKNIDKDYIESVINAAPAVSGGVL